MIFFQETIKSYQWAKIYLFNFRDTFSPWHTFCVFFFMTIDEQKIRVGLNFFGKFWVTNKILLGSIEKIYMIEIGIIGIVLTNTKGAHQKVHIIPFYTNRRRFVS